MNMPFHNPSQEMVLIHHSPIGELTGHCLGNAGYLVEFGVPYIVLTFLAVVFHQSARWLA